MPEIGAMWQLLVPTLQTVQQSERPLESLVVA